MDKQCDQSLLYLFIYFRLCFLYLVQLVYKKLLIIYLFIVKGIGTSSQKREIKNYLLNFDQSRGRFFRHWRQRYHQPRPRLANGMDHFISPTRLQRAWIIIFRKPTQKKNFKITPFLQSRDIRLKKNPFPIGWYTGTLVHRFCTRSVLWSVFGAIFGKSICCSLQIK